MTSVKRTKVMMTNLIRGSMIKLIPEGFQIVVMMSNLQVEVTIIEILATKEVVDSLIQEC